ncbi:MAG: CDP-glycerol glycerophosphotransferase family protein [Desulfobacterales bacterium]|jgi:hypothetical protein
MMKVVFAIHHAGAFRSYDGVIRYLCSQGHQVTVLHGEREKPIRMDRALKACLAEMQSCDDGQMYLRKNWVWLANIRELVNCAIYLRPRHPNPSHARRWINKVNQPLRFVAKTRTGMKLMASPRIRRALQRIETVIPPERTITQWLESNAPDVVFASPYISPVSRELEYVKAAQALGFPTVVGVLSWDNLTTKGTFHIMPDWILVWNDALAKEATELHDVPAKKIFMTGAPVFDFWSEMHPSNDYATFCSQVGIPPDQPYILYLGSSPFIAHDETPFVREFAQRLLESEKTKDISLVVRPHPTNAAFWQTFKAENVAIWPQDGEYVDAPEAKQVYYDTLFHSTAVVGVNTSAMLEAAIVDKPCVTIMTEHYRNTQGKVGHFKHLLDADFLEIALSFAEATDIIAAVRRGRDLKKEQRRRFVREFIRPHGMGLAASQIMAKAIEAAALRKDLNQIMTA